MDKVDYNKKELYKCDPNKNTSCSKTGCFYTVVLGECKYTTNPEFSKDGIAYSVNELFAEEMSRMQKLRDN